MTMLILTGCSDLPAEKTLSPKSLFSNSFTLDYNSLQIKGKLNISENGTFTVNLFHPSALNGMTAVINEEKLKIRYKGISTDFNLEKLPETAFLPVLYSSLSQVFTKDNLSFEKENDGYSVSCVTDAGKCEMIIDDDCRILSLRIKEKKFYINFHY